VSQYFLITLSGLTQSPYYGHHLIRLLGDGKLGQDNPTFRQIGTTKCTSRVYDPSSVPTSGERIAQFFLARTPTMAAPPTVARPTPSAPGTSFFRSKPRIPPFGYACSSSRDGSGMARHRQSPAPCG
jgi:hypothetical protein